MDFARGLSGSQHGISDCPAAREYHTGRVGAASRKAAIHDFGDGSRNAAGRCDRVSTDRSDFGGRSGRNLRRDRAFNCRGRAIMSSASICCPLILRVHTRTVAALPRSCCSPWSRNSLANAAAASEVPRTASNSGPPTTSGVLRVRVNPCNRLAVLTVSPITVNDMLCSLPTSPRTAGP